MTERGRRPSPVLPAVSSSVLPAPTLVFSAISLSVIPDIFNRESIFRGNPGGGHDRAYRMREKKKDSGCPITLVPDIGYRGTVGHDREKPPSLSGPARRLLFCPSRKFLAGIHLRREKRLWMPDNNRRE